MHPQPAFGIVIVLVNLAGLLGVLDRGLRPHLAGAEVDPSAAVHWVALQDHGKLLQVHRQRAQHRDRAVAERRYQGLPQLAVALPVPLSEGVDAGARQFGCTVGVGGDRRQQAVSYQLQRVGRPRHLAQDRHEARAVALVDDRSQVRQCFAIVHGGSLFRERPVTGLNQTPAPGRREQSRVSELGRARRMSGGDTGRSH